MSDITPFTSGPQNAVSKLNDIIRQLNSLSNFTGDGLITVNRTLNGYAISLNLNMLKGRLAYNSSSGGVSIVKAFCMADAGEGNTLMCHVGEEYSAQADGFEVKFSIIGGENLNAAVPRLSLGDMIFIMRVSGEWWCTTLMQASEDCDCYAAV